MTCTKMLLNIHSRMFAMVKAGVVVENVSVSLHTLVPTASSVLGMKCANWQPVVGMDPMKCVLNA